MVRNMKQWVADTIANPHKQAIPILSYPSVQLMNTSVRELISNSALQAKGMQLIAQRTDSGASVSLMDLSVEAEAFGADIHYAENEVPTVVGHLINTEEEAEALPIPSVGTARTGVYLDAMAQAVQLISDRPVLAGVIGPYSLAGRLLGVSEAMVLCYEEPDLVHTVLEKATQFLIDYCKAYQQVGANGVVMAEPLAGLLSPTLAEEFSAPYVKRIVDAVQSDTFLVVYHNCGNNVEHLTDAIVSCGAGAYHFGNACDLSHMIPHIPQDCLVMGNVDPAGQICNGTPESIRAETRRVLEQCSYAPNFVLSSGCDIPSKTPWENIDAFFSTAIEFYGGTVS